MNSILNKVKDEEITLLTSLAEYVGRAFVPANYLLKTGRQLPEAVSYGDRVFKRLIGSSKYIEMDVFDVEGTFMVYEDDPENDGE